MDLPAAIFDAAVMRGLDARARREIEDAGHVRDLSDGDEIYRAGDEGTSFFVVAKGEVTLKAVRRGEDHESVLRVAGPGECFGEEATASMARRATAIATARAIVAEIPAPVFLRVAERAGAAGVASRIARTLGRKVMADLFAASALTRDLEREAQDALLDASSVQRFARGEHVYRAGDPAESVLVVADGILQIQIEDGDRLLVRGYVTRGDFFGDVEVMDQRPRSASAVATGPVVLVAIPAATFRRIAGQKPEIVRDLRRIADDQGAHQRAIVGRAAENATQHAFRDLYRLEVARSLLVIDLEACVRCGHCAWSCSEAHGTARIVRRGDKIVARLDGAAKGAAGAPQHLMLPNSCQHCEHPACMIDCPTGAIGRDPSGEVFIRDALCTGCGACAKACPWDNIQMAERPADAARPSGAAYPEIAVKCDLCRGYEAPACVEACPTSAIHRINPSEEVADLRELFGVYGPRPKGARATAGARPPRPLLAAGAAIAALGIGAAGVVMQARGVIRPADRIGWGAGVLAAIAMLALTWYAVPKRAVRWLHKKREGEPRDVEPARGASRTERQLDVHVALGIVASGVALAHVPPDPSRWAGHGGALAVAFFVASIAGGLLALFYAIIPPRLARIERSATLPEDYDRARRELFDRLYREATGKSDLVKKVLERVLVPYAQRLLGPLALIVSGRSLRDEERAIHDRVDALLEGRGKDRLAGLSALVRVVVELRALPAQRILAWSLRAPFWVHVIAFTVALALLLVHVVAALGRPR